MWLRFIDRLYAAGRRLFSYDCSVLEIFNGLGSAYWGYAAMTGAAYSVSVSAWFQMLPSIKWMLIVPMIAAGLIQTAAVVGHAYRPHNAWIMLRMAMALVSLSAWGFIALGFLAVAEARASFALYVILGAEEAYVFWWLIYGLASRSGEGGRKPGDGPGGRGRLRYLDLRQFAGINGPLGMEVRKIEERIEKRCRAYRHSDDARG